MVQAGNHFVALWLSKRRTNALASPLPYCRVDFSLGVD